MARMAHSFTLSRWRPERVIILKINESGESGARSEQESIAARPIPTIQALNQTLLFANAPARQSSLDTPELEQDCHLAPFSGASKQFRATRDDFSGSNILIDGIATRRVRWRAVGARKLVLRVSRRLDIQMLIVKRIGVNVRDILQVVGGE